MERVFRGKRFALTAMACLLVSASFPVRAQDASAAAYSRDKTAAEFRELDEAGEKIDPKNLREELLSAAIFHETNRRRANEKLPPLDFNENARKAAVEHSKKMAAGNYLSHGTANEKKNTTPYERLVEQGLQPRFSAENIAFTFVLRYESGKPFYTREEDGRTVYSYEPGGKPLERHTYLSFAESILTQWMNSPPHRKNIVSEEPQFLGVGCALAHDAEGFRTIYATQDFFTPLGEAPGNP